VTIYLHVKGVESSGFCSVNFYAKKNAKAVFTSWSAHYANIFLFNRIRSVFSKVYQAGIYPTDKRGTTNKENYV
jgi:hypothetical protein